MLLSWLNSEHWKRCAFSCPFNFKRVDSFVYTFSKLHGRYIPLSSITLLVLEESGDQDPVSRLHLSVSLISGMESVCALKFKLKRLELSTQNLVDIQCLCQQMAPRHWYRHLYPVDWIIAMHCFMAYLMGSCVAYNWSRTPPRASPVRRAVITSRQSCDNFTGCPSVIEWRLRSPSWSFSV